MRKLTMLIAVSGLVCSAVSAQTQNTQPGSRLELKVAGRKPPPTPQKEPGDSIYIDGETDDIVAESRGRKIRLPNKSKAIHGALDVTVASAGAGMYRYDYQLSNGQGAKRQISAVILHIPQPEKATKKVEAGWAAMDKKADPFLPASTMIGQVGPDVQPRLKPGQKTSFTISSPDLPGFVEARILPRDSETPIQANPTELTDGQFTDGASEWMRAQLLQLNTIQRYELTITTIGPKVPPEFDNLMVVRGEFSSALNQSELRSMSSKLLEISNMADAKQMLDALPNGGTPFQKAFLEAMSIRLKRLQLN